jgi:hypothetical protein
MTNTAAGYVADTPENVYVASKGRAPLDWWGITPPDGDATPWASAPVGSRYLQKENETLRAVYYIKVDNNENDHDWASFSLGRTVAGGPVGLLLALTRT